MTRAALLAALGLSLLACKGEQTETQPQTEPATPAADAGSLDSEDAFLAALIPLPDGLDAIEVRYGVSGSGLTGEVTVTLGPGGRRHERWQLQADVADPSLRTAGVRIVTPDRIWTANDGAPGKLEINHLGNLARAYMELEPQMRAKVAASVGEWYELLAEQRKLDKGVRGEVLGVSCLQTRIAAQNVCMWEEANVLLRYEGSAFTLEATQIDRAPKLAADVFALPAAAGSTELQDSPAPDYAKVLQDIAAGSYGSVSALVLGVGVLPPVGSTTPL
jgi:hypothetical protein